MIINLIIPSAEEMRENTQNIFDKEQVEKQVQQKQNNQILNSLIVYMWDEITNLLNDTNSSTKIQYVVKPDDIFSEYTCYNDKKYIIDKAIEKVITGLNQAGYDVNYTIYSRTWYYKSGKYATIEINWR